VAIGLGFLILTGLALVVIFWEARRSGRMISQWAADHKYEVLEKKQPFVNLGPFRRDKPAGRTFYRVTVRDAEGQARGGWISCGVWWPGPHTNRVVMRWNAGEAPEAASRFRQAEDGVWPPPPAL